MNKKVILITGGSGFLGREIAIKLIESLYDLIIVDKSISQSLKNDLTSKETKTLFIEADISLPESFDFILSKSIENFPKIDGIINNAALYDDPEWKFRFPNESYNTWNEVLKVNLIAPFFIIQKLYPMLLKSQLPCIINIGSIYGVCAPSYRLYEGTQMSNPASYGASKGGLLQLTRWLSTSLAPKIRVNSVSPGGIYRGQPDSFVDKYCQSTPLSRMATESDVAHMVKFLLSEEAAYVTGQNILVDGGWSAH